MQKNAEGIFGKNEKVDTVIYDCEAQLVPFIKTYSDGFQIHFNNKKVFDNFTKVAEFAYSLFEDSGKLPSVNSNSSVDCLHLS